MKNYCKGLNASFPYNRVGFYQNRPETWKDDWTEQSNFTITSANTRERKDNPSVPAVQSTKSAGPKRVKIILLLAIGLAATISIYSVRLTKKTALPGLEAKTQKIIPPAKQEAKIISPQEEEKKTPAKKPVDETAKNFRKNWSKYLTANNSNYAYGVLGGINNLSVVFTNKTDYPIEEMTAKLVYVKANGVAWKTKSISVYNLLPHSDRTQSLPRVNRGKSVQVVITRIVSKKMRFDYSKDRKGSDPNDPYFK